MGRVEKGMRIDSVWLVIWVNMHVGIRTCDQAHSNVKRVQDLAGVNR